jgi:prepilin-type N-terminal cleavage/methylation domain-containing protein
VSKHLVPARPDAGFTLIEVIIVLVILVFISLGIYQMTTETFKLRNSLANEGEFTNSVRMAMDVVNRDISGMFSPVLSKPEPAPSTTPNPQAIQDQAALAASDQGKTSEFWLGATDSSGLRLSRFVGTASRISFISVSHVRIYRDKPESDFAKISYELVADPDYTEAPGTSALIRIENPDAFDDDDRRSEKQATRYPILHGVNKLRFRFWRKDKGGEQGKWETTWDTEREEFKDKYPDIVEVTIEVTGPDKLTHSGIYKFKPEVPLRGLAPSS